MKERELLFSFDSIMDIPPPENLKNLVYSQDRSHQALDNLTPDEVY